MIVTNYAHSSIELLLPQLENGMFDANWRIRQSSVQLVGDLLYKITGASGKTQVDGSEDDSIGTEEGGRAVLEVLGQKRRDNLLASLYILRSDVSLPVRQSALHVWKTIVSNTPRAMREVLPAMMRIIINCLASSNYDKRQVGGRTLGDLVRKLGDRILPEVVPILEEGLKSPKADTRQGVCVGLSEIMAAAGRSQVAHYLGNIAPSIKVALCDPSPDVREPAAEAFNSLHRLVGRSALDEILPPLLSDLNNSDTAKAELALEGLKTITAVKSAVVFPILIEHLLHPLTSSNAKALGAIIPHSGEALGKFLPEITSGLIETAIEAKKGHTENPTQVKETIQILLTSVDNEESVRVLLSDLIEKSNNDNVDVRAQACEFINIFCSETKANYGSHLSNLIAAMLSRFDDKNPDIVHEAWGALDRIIKAIKKEELQQYIGIIRKTLKGFLVEGKQVEIRGFCIPRGIVPLETVFLQGLQSPSNEVREQSANGISDLIMLSNEEVLTASVSSITGRLINILGGKIPWEVKAAILNTICLLIDKVKGGLKLFISPLQTLCVKALNDPTTFVRQKAAEGLGKLVAFQPKVDSLINELHTGAKSSEGDVQATYLKALQMVLNVSGKNVTEPILKSIFPTANTLLADSNEQIRTAAANCVAAYCQYLKEGDFVELMKTRLLVVEKSATPEERFGLARVIFMILKKNPDSLLANPQLLPLTIEAVKGEGLDEKVPVSQVGAHSLRFVLCHSKAATEPSLIPTVVKIINEKPADTKRTIIASLKIAAKNNFEIIRPHLKIVIPPLMLAVKEKNVPVKLAAERALLYCLNLKAGTQVYEEYLQTLTGENQRNLADYHKRVLSKLASSSEASDVEDDDKPS